MRKSGERFQESGHREIGTSENKEVLERMSADSRGLGSDGLPQISLLTTLHDLSGTVSSYSVAP
jgi:hypothetical protein